MPFKNRIRIPLYLNRAQFPTDRNVERLANGATKMRSVVIRKVYTGQTDYLPEHWHQKLIIALSHDNVTVETDRYLGNISLDGDYDIDWQEFLDYPVAKAEFKAQVTPFDYTNSNCMTCDTASQLSTEDDVFDDVYNDPIDMQESTEYEKNVLANDDVCCSPAVITLIYWNNYYLTAASIDQAGILTVTVGSGLIAVNNILLATYRVACPDGSYDEADVYGNIDGSIEGCLAPLNVEIINISSTAAAARWDEPSPAPTQYNWELYEASNMGTPVQTGTEPAAGPVTVDLTGLDPFTQYVFLVRSDCPSMDSEWTQLDFITLPPDEAESCGKYEVEYDDGTGDRTGYGDISYIDCNSDQKTVRVPNGHTRLICALQNEPNDPVQIIGATLITYIEEC